ncbi:MAG: hypothetical protein U5O39_07375 [Gammaproteobacteria bacterium]|nr:hypothetical protein [Gammaproteobacteria bacterium]
MGFRLALPRPLLLSLLMSLLMSLLLSALSWPLSAAEFYTHAQVIRTEPIEADSETVICRTGSPRADDLIATLAWDLCTGDFASIETTTRINGYRVYYKWNDREMSRVVDAPPGPRLPIRVRLQPAR